MGVADTIVHLPSVLTPIQLFGVAVVISALFYLGLVQRPVFPSNAPVVIPGDWPITGSLGFFTARHDWWKRAQSLTSSKNFSFHVGKYRLIGTASDEGRKQYFENRGLGFAEGFAVLFGQSPDYTEGPDAKIARSLDSDKFAKAATEPMEARAPHFTRRIVPLLKRDVFSKKIDILTSDVRGRLEELAAQSENVTDPFDSIYKIVYLLTMRMVGATEVAEDRALLDKTLELFATIEKTATASAIMFPWLPTPAKAKRLYSGGRMYMIFQKIVDARKKSDRRYDDALQYLLDEGDDMTQIISFVVGALFAGQLNSGINAAWVLCYLATTPRWLGEIRKEVKTVVDKYHPGPGALVDKLGKLPLEAWEGEFPMVDLCLKDSIRLQLHGTGFRRNITGKDIPLGGEVIPPDGFLLFHFGDYHRDPNTWTDPNTWDPARYLPDRAEDKKTPHGFVGWGAGRHPCLGMRFAKLEQNIITAYFCTMFDFELLDAAGNVMQEQPVTNTNNWQASPPDEKLRLRFKLREEVMT